MRVLLGVMLVEEENGEIAVQLFSEPIDKAVESFDNMAGKVGDKPQRATFLKIGYGDKPEVMMKTKSLPVPQPPKSEMPDAWVLGKGPVKFDEEKKP